MTARSSFLSACLLAALPFVASLLGLKRLLFAGTGPPLPEPIQGLCQVAWRQSVDMVGHLAIAIAMVLVVGIVVRTVSVLVVGVYQTRRLQAAAKTISVPLFDHAALPLVVQKVRLIEHGPPLALAAGLLRPQVYLSRSLIDLLSASELEAVVRHELIHVLRHDPLRILVMQSLRAALPVVPALMFLFRVFDARKETEADALVSAQMGTPSPLASALLKLLNHSVSNRAWAGLTPTEERIDYLVGAVRPGRNSKDLMTMFLVSGISLGILTSLFFLLASRPTMVVAHICQSI